MYNQNNLIGVVDSRLATYMKRLISQGSANNTNYGFQFDGLEILSTTETILGTGYDGSGVFYENGLVALLPWIPKQNRKPLDMNKIMEYNGDYGQVTIPEFPGIPFAIHAYSQRADRQSYGGERQDLVMEFEVSIDMGFADAPLSTLRGANDTVLYAAGVLAS